MKNYEIIIVLNMNNTCINKLYKYLIINKYHFLILYWNNKKYVLTKEKSIIEIDDEKIFLKDINNDIYYKTIIKNDYIKINNKDLNIYKKYINMYKDILTKNKYADKYYFGCVAVKTKNGFITTIRGKENLDDYTIIENVDHVNHTIYAINKKGSLNVPLLDYLFKNTNAQIIVHLHEYDSNLPYYEYAFPGTFKDSIRCNKTSFNIKHHGVIYIFDKKGRLI